MGGTILARKSKLTARIDPELLHLTYKELAERMGISVDAARMKAKREAKKGRWQIIPGNHPSDKVTVIIPDSDLNTQGERVGTDEAERYGYAKGRTPKPEQDEKLFTLYADAQARIQMLTDQLLEAQNDRIELAASTMREMALAAEIDALQAQLNRALADVAYHRRTWWQRLTNSNL
jgi:enoyl-CoA hydratase/carnithine racemase